MNKYIFSVLFSALNEAHCPNSEMCPDVASTH